MSIEDARLAMRDFLIKTVLPCGLFKVTIRLFAMYILRNSGFGTMKRLRKRRVVDFARSTEM